MLSEDFWRENRSVPDGFIHPSPGVGWRESLLNGTETPRAHEFETPARGGGHQNETPGRGVHGYLAARPPRNDSSFGRTPVRFRPDKLARNERTH